MTSAAFFLELGGVVLGLAILARVATRFGLSPIPLYLLAGLSVGEGGIAPLVTSKDFIEAGAEIGVVLLLFMLGLSYSPRELTGHLRASAPAGIADALLNFTPGFVAGAILNLDPLATILLGGITYMSSTGVIAKLIEDLRWVGNRETPVVLAILVVEDLAMAAYLPVVAVLIRGGSVATSSVNVLIAVAVVVAILAIASRWGGHISRAVFSRSDETLLFSLLGLILLIAGLGQALNVSAAVGAFLVGIALSGPAEERARTLLGPLRDVFAAAFFVFFGLEIDPSSIPPVAGAALALAAVTAATKVLTGWWAAGRAGIGTRGRYRAGAVLVARGEFSIAIAGLGIAAGFDERFGPLVAAYVLALAVAGPIVARVIDPFVAARVRARRARSAG